MKNNCVQTIKVITDTDNEELVNSLCERLSDEFSEGDWDYQFEKNGKLSIICKEGGFGKVYPGCRTLPNGDPGYPDDYEFEFEIYDGSVEEEIEKFMDELPEEERFDCTVTQEVEWFEEDYYD